MGLRRLDVLVSPLHLDYAALTVSWLSYTVKNMRGLTESLRPLPDQPWWVVSIWLAEGKMEDKGKR